MNDPINPAHYNGTACAQIGELLTANSYQVLKYNWRLGKKDDPIIEVGKSIWYLDREIALAKSGYDPARDLPDNEFFHDLLKGCDFILQATAWNLINWTRYGDFECLEILRKELVRQRANLEHAATGQHIMEL